MPPEQPAEEGGVIVESVAAFDEWVCKAAAVEIHSATFPEPVTWLAFAMFGDIAFVVGPLIAEEGDGIDAFESIICTDKRGNGVLY